MELFILMIWKIIIRIWRALKFIWKILKFIREVFYWIWLEIQLVWNNMGTFFDKLLERWDNFTDWRDDCLDYWSDYWSKRYASWKCAFKFIKYLYAPAWWLFMEVLKFIVELTVMCVLFVIITRIWLFFKKWNP